jgi:hypothetical protein
MAGISKIKRSNIQLMTFPKVLDFQKGIWGSAYDAKAIGIPLATQKKIGLNPVWDYSTIHLFGGHQSVAH